MKLKTKIFLIVILLGVIYNTYYYFSTKGDKWYNPTSTETGEKCGVIVDNFSQDRRVKHGRTTDLYMKIQYPNTIEIQKVATETWYSYSVGDRICFATTEFTPLTGYVMILTALAIMLVLLRLFLYFIGWIFDIENTDF